MIKSLLKDFTKQESTKDAYVALSQYYGYATYDHKLTLLSSNAKFIELIQKEKNIFLNLHQGIEFKEKCWRRILHGETLQEEFRLITDQSVHLAVSFIPIKESGIVSRVVVLTKEITSDKEASIEADAILKAINKSYAYIKFDKNGHILDANSVFTEVTGFANKNELIEQHHSIFVTEAYRNSTEYSDFWHHLNNGDLHQGTFERVRRDGEKVFLQATYSPVFDQLGEVKYVIKIAKDVTENIRSSERLREIKDTIDLSFGNIQFDVNGNVLEVNENFYQLLGYSSSEEVVGKHHSIFVDPDYVKTPDYARFWKELAEGVTQEGEFRRITKSGEEVWIQAAYTPVKNSQGDVVSIIKIAADVTEQKVQVIRAKKELRKEVLNNLKEISTSIVQIAAGSRDQAVKTDSASSLIETALQTSNNVATMAEEITGLAKDASAHSQVGESTVSELIQAMNRLTDVASESERTMQSFLDNTKQINQVIKVIKEIAAQTNLLALNASIEAAQAGDYGRGFAVIAKEIRELSENSKDSTQEIESLISGVQQNSVKVAEAMKEVNDHISGGVQAVNNVSDIFKKMNDSTQETSSVSGNILEASQKQSEGMKELVRSIESIVVISEQTAAGAEEVSSAAKALENQVDRF